MIEEFCRHVGWFLMRGLNLSWLEYASEIVTWWLSKRQV